MSFYLLRLTKILDFPSMIPASCLRTRFGVCGNNLSQAETPKDPIESKRTGGLERLVCRSICRIVSFRTLTVIIAIRQVETPRDPIREYENRRPLLDSLEVYCRTVIFLGACCNYSLSQVETLRRSLIESEREQEGPWKGLFAELCFLGSLL